MFASGSRDGRVKWAGEQGQILRTLSLIPSPGGAIQNYKAFFFSKETETKYRKASLRKMPRLGLTKESTCLYPKEKNGRDGGGGWTRIPLHRHPPPSLGYSQHRTRLIIVSLSVPH